jgi:23S rRNA pseudouridine1911/1915/1917 synthase
VEQVRHLVAARRVTVGGTLCLDYARRLAAGDAVELMPGAAPKPRERKALVVRQLDDHLVVVERSSGLPMVRHPAERSWSARRKALHPKTKQRRQEKK